MHNLLRNWRTSGAGIGAILVALGDIINQIVNKDFDAQRFGADIAALITGFGLLAARDNKVSVEEHEHDRRWIKENHEEVQQLKEDVK